MLGDHSTIDPNVLIDAGNVVKRGEDFAFQGEMLAARFKKKYLALEAGGQEAALEAGRRDAAARLVKMGASVEDATAFERQVGSR